MMQRSLSLRLQALACQALSRIDHLPAAPVEAVASDGASTLTLRLAPSGDAPLAAGIAEPGTDSLAGLLFSPQERSIVELVGDRALSARAIAKPMGMLDGSAQANTTLRLLLRNLVLRGIFDNGADGYRLTPGGRRAAEMAGITPTHVGGRAGN